MNSELVRENEFFLVQILKEGISATEIKESLNLVLKNMGTQPPKQFKKIIELLSSAKKSSNTSNDAVSNCVKQNYGKIVLLLNEGLTGKEIAQSLCGDMKIDDMNFFIKAVQSIKKLKQESKEKEREKEKVFVLDSINNK